MKRPAPVILTTLLLAAATPVRASCSDDVRAAQQNLASAKNLAHRREQALLLQKAEMDAAAGREKLCRDALVRAQALEQ